MPDNEIQDQQDEQTEQHVDEVVDEPTVDEQEVDSTEDELPETFPRSVVEKLRQENGKYRQRAQRADDLAAALWSTRVEATGRLADATDLPMPDDADPLDTDAVTTAVEALLARKPHLAARKVRGDVGQGATGGSSSVDLAGILRANAG